MPGTAGTHSVCVLTIHQNAKLLLPHIGSTCKELRKILVFDIDSKKDKVQGCLNCPESTDIFSAQVT